jgi:hypothetical protein
MKCPHCLNAYHPQVKVYDLGEDKDHFWRIYWQKCPSCDKYIIELRNSLNKDFILFQKSFLVYPKAISRVPLSTDVPDEFAKDYKEACLVIADSPKASAALSRRCLQNILRGKAGVKKSDLSKEIEEVLQSKQLPSHLAQAIDAVRNIGAFAAHPIKSTNTGEIVDVEPGEAEWLLDVLEGLFDFYFVQPAELARKREALNKKLTDAGKPPMK